MLPDYLSITASDSQDQPGRPDRAIFARAWASKIGLGAAGVAHQC